MKNPLQYSIYKGTGGKWGAIQFNLQPPHYYNGKQKDFVGTEAIAEGRRLNEGWKIREGAIFMEAAPARDKNVYLCKDVGNVISIPKETH